MKNDQKILIVEDEESLVEAVSTAVSENGFTVLKARNGKEGLEIALKEHPDLTLLDIAMPVMDGIAMLKELRKDEWGKNAKIIFLTGLNDLDKIREAVDNKVSNYLMKQDWNMQDIVGRIKKELEEE